MLWYLKANCGLGGLPRHRRPDIAELIYDIDEIMHICGIVVRSENVGPLPQLEWYRAVLLKTSHNLIYLVRNVSEKRKKALYDLSTSLGKYSTPHISIKLLSSPQA
jgi:hypothetical protein